MGAGNTQQGQQDSGGGYESVYPFVEVQFTDTSSGADSVLWDFGDGETSTERNPKHKYYENGDFIVTLLVTNEGGTDSSQQTIQVTGVTDNGDEGDIGDNEGGTTAEQKPSGPPSGYQFAPPVFNLMDGTLSPQGQWIWDAKSTTNPTLHKWVSNTNNNDNVNDNDNVNESQVVYGCTDSAAMNYNPNATQEDGSCQYEVFGCTDSSATNYNPLATTDDGSCQYPPPPPTTQTYTLTGTLSQFGTSNTGPFSISNANYPTLIEDINIGNPIKVNNLANVIAEVNRLESRITLSLGVVGSTYGDSFSFSMSIVSEQIGLQPEDTSGNTSGNTGGDTGGDIPEVLGCTDPNALNYNSLATKDDGSCTYETDDYIPPK